MIAKKDQLQQARARRHHVKAKMSGRPRLIVVKSNKAIYAQVFDDQKGIIVASANSLKGKNGVEGAQEVGKLVAEKALKAKVSEIAFDRNGNKYHGQIKALADAAREAGLKF